MTQRTVGSFLTPIGFTQPSTAAVLREGSLVREAGRYAAQAPSAGAVRRRSPYASRTAARIDELILLVPGFLAGDASLRLMNRSLRQEGFRTYRSQMRANVGARGCRSLGTVSSKRDGIVDLARVHRPAR